MIATVDWKQKKAVGLYLLKFAAVFVLFYFGTLGIIGLSSPENEYSPFVARYLNFVDPLRSSILRGASSLLSLLGEKSHRIDRFTLGIADGSAVRMVYSCVGYGVMSFWIALISANAGSWQRKTTWIVGGLFLLWCINVMRISLLVVATSRQWPMPFGWDHHTWFNVVAYGGIFALMYLYDRSTVKEAK